MNAKELAKVAVKSVEPHRSVLSPEICTKLALAYVAQWLTNQDEDIRSKAAATACQAIDLIHQA